MCWIFLGNVSCRSLLDFHVLLTQTFKFQNCLVQPRLSRVGKVKKEKGRLWWRVVTWHTCRARQSVGFDENILWFKTLTLMKWCYMCWISFKQCKLQICFICFHVVQLKLLNSKTVLHGHGWAGILQRRKKYNCVRQGKQVTWYNYCAKL